MWFVRFAHPYVRVAHLMSRYSSCARACSMGVQLYMYMYAALDALEDWNRSGALDAVPPLPVAVPVLSARRSRVRT